MRERARKARWILRERRRCARDGFCRFCISPRLLPLLHATQDLVGRAVFRECLDWARGDGEEPAFFRPLSGYELYLMQRYGTSGGGRPRPERIL